MLLSKKKTNNYLNAKHLTIVHISLPLYSIFSKCGFFFFWLLFLFQRFVESTFFCGMYKYIIFVSILLLSYYLVILLLSLFAVSVLFVPFFIYTFSGFPSIKVDFFFFESTAYPSSDKPRHVTLPNLYAFICFCFFFLLELMIGSVKMTSDYISKYPGTPQGFFCPSLCPHFAGDPESKSE